MNLLFDQLTPALPESYKQMKDVELKKLTAAKRRELGDRLFLPGHHYQRDEVIQFADVTGDSLQLARQSAARPEADIIVFLGVHFMAETADMLTPDRQRVILPDLRAGCSMADMADDSQCETAWERLTEKYGDTILPVTYVNSSAAVKAFVGRHGGTTVTSSNAEAVMKWAYTQKKRVLFLPDQHLGRNTAYKGGMSRESMAVWDPQRGELTPDVPDAKLDDTKLILWRGHCSVHENFRMQHIEDFRKREPERRILVHPECTWDVTQAADLAGSTSYIIQQIEQAPAGSKWAVGTEMNLVQRLASRHPEQSIVSLNPDMCPCLTMNRIDLPHLAWVLDEAAAGNIVHDIRVDKETAADARLAIDRMMKLTQ